MSVSVHIVILWVAPLLTVCVCDGMPAGYKVKNLTYECDVVAENDCFDLLDLYKLDT